MPHKYNYAQPHDPIFQFCTAISSFVPQEQMGYSTRADT